MQRAERADTKHNRKDSGAERERGKRYSPITLQHIDDIFLLLPSGGSLQLLLRLAVYVQHKGFGATRGALILGTLQRTR